MDRLRQHIGKVAIATALIVSAVWLMWLVGSQVDAKAQPWVVDARSQTSLHKG